MTQHPNVAPDIVARLRLVCLELPEAYEEQAWVGTRWCVSKKNFAHVLVVKDGWPPAYAKAASKQGPITLVTFRVPLAKIERPRFIIYPFFRPMWFPNIVGLVLDGCVDWDDLGELLIESYCLLAPKKLVVLLDRPN